MKLRSFKYTLILAVLIFILSAIQAGSLPKPTFKAADKVGHFLAYLGLCSTFLTEYAKSIRWSSKTGRWLIGIFMICVGYGVLMEVLQGTLFYYRSFDILDMAANSVGALLGVLTFLALFNVLKRYERYY